jgi:hypothetical protein
MSSELFRKYINIINEQAAPYDGATSNQWAEAFTDLVSRKLGGNIIDDLQALMHKAIARSGDKSRHWVFHSPPGAKGHVTLEFPLVDAMGRDVSKTINELYRTYLANRKDEKTDENQSFGAYITQPVVKQHGDFSVLTFSMGIPKGLQFSK